MDMTEWKQTQYKEAIWVKEEISVQTAYLQSAPHGHHYRHCH